MKRLLGLFVGALWLLPVSAMAQSAPLGAGYSKWFDTIKSKMDASGGVCTTCTLNGGLIKNSDISTAIATALNGSTSRSLNSKLSDMINVMDYGAKCDGSTDDAGAINAALASAGANTRISGIVYLPGSATCKFGSTLKIPDNVSLVGQGIKSSTLQATNVSFTPQIQVEGSYSLVANFMLVSGNAGTPGYPASGYVSIDMGASSSLVMDHINNVWIDGPCIGIDMAGNNQIVSESYVNYSTGSGCAGIRVGHNTTGAGTTDPHITDTTIATAQGLDSAPDAAVLVEDAGGLTMTGDDFLYALHGTSIKPGANQQVLWVFASNTVLGDTTYYSPLLVDTNDSTAIIKGLNFEGVWASNSQHGPAIEIDNTKTGSINGIRISGLRAYTNAADGVDVNSTVTGFSLEYSHLCGNGQGGGSAIYLNPNTAKFRITGNLISQACDGQTSNNTVGVNLGGSNDDGIVEGNDMTGLTTPMSVTSPVSDANLIITNNIPTSTQLYSIADTSSMDLPLGYEGYGITTSGTTITNMTSAWNGRSVTLYSANSLTFSTGGATGSAICNNFTSTANVPIEAKYYGCWYLK